MENEELADFSEEQHTIQDNTGETYSVRFLRSDQLWNIKLFHNGRLIGAADCPVHSAESLLLGNIEIFSTAVPPSLMAGDTAPQPPPPDYRGRGLGTLLLNFVITQARLSGFQRITGHLHPQNLADNPALPDWYRRRKFNVRMNADGRGGTISLDLASGEDGVVGTA